MPTYEYKREDGSTFEIWQGINDEPLEKCPETGQKVKRIISGGGGVLYKGEGFYVNDYKKNSGNESDNQSTAESDSKETSNSDGSTESKNSSNESGSASE